MRSAEGKFLFAIALAKERERESERERERERESEREREIDSYSRAYPVRIRDGAVPKRGAWGLPVPQRRSRDCGCCWWSVYIVTLLRHSHITLYDP